MVIVSKPRRPLWQIILFSVILLSILALLLIFWVPALMELVRVCLPAGEMNRFPFLALYSSLSRTGADTKEDGRKASDTGWRTTRSICPRSKDCG